MSSDELWEKVKQATDTARVKNAIFSIETKSEFLEDKGVKFNVSVSTALAKKPSNLPTTSEPSVTIPATAQDTPTTNVKIENNTITTTTTTGDVTSETTTTISASTPTAAAAAATIASAATLEKVSLNPFLPHDPDMFVASINDTHNLLLNKYNVVDYHMVLTTKGYEKQTDPLNEIDFAALWSVVNKMHFMGFFNGGPLSGASQPHKHMQLLPPPVSDASRPSFEAPIEQLISKVSISPNVTFRIPEMDFKHSCIILDQDILAQPNPEKYLFTTYHNLLDSQKLREGEAGSKSYNLLLTSKWMLIVPRSNEKYGNIAINSIGFLGSILVKTQEDLVALKETGPMAVLKHVTFPNDN